MYNWSIHFSAPINNWEYSSHIQSLKKINHCSLASRHMLYFISKFLSCSCLPFQILCLFLQILLTEKKKLQYFVCLFCYRFPDWTILTAISSVNFNFHQFWHSDCPVLGKVDYFMLFDLEVISCYIFIHTYPRFSKFFLVLFIVLNISVKTRLEKN